MALPRSVDLFRRYQKRFQKVEFMPIGFRHPCHSTTDPGMVCQKLYLDIRHLGHKEHAGSMINGPSWLDLGECKLTFNLTVKCGQHNMVKQIEETIWQAVLDGPLKNLQLRMRPKESRDSTFWGIQAYENAMIDLSVEGKMPKGLHLPQELRVWHDGWKTFIPPGPERGAILAALELERRQNSVAFHDLRKAEDGLSEMLEKAR